jgi:hypothetical protein
MIRAFPTARTGGELIPVLRPQSSKNQHGTAIRIGKQGAQAGSDALTDLRSGQVVLRLVQPHHSARPDTREAFEGSVGSCGIEGMPQAPPMRGQQLNGFPAGPCLSG